MFFYFCTKKIIIEESKEINEVIWVYAVNNLRSHAEHFEIKTMIKLNMIFDVLCCYMFMNITI